jgi:glycerol-3-phosphate dehydrogenase
VNATGVWADELRRLDDPSYGTSIRPAKGVHLTVPRDKLPCDLAAVLPVPNDRRTIFVVPWDEHTYIGTTDTAYEGSLDDPRVEPEDVAYVLRAVNAAVSSPIGPEDVTATWAGLRPLLATTGVRGRGRSARTADLSRRHQVQRSGSGLVSITGGKLTTYRKMAVDAVDAVERELGSTPGPCRTKHLRLRGSEGLTAPRIRELAGEFGVDADILDHLRRRYGGEAAAVLGLTVNRPELRTRLVPGLAHLEAEVVYAARYEMATCVEDVLSRRTRALLLDARSSAAAAGRTAELLAAELGWEASRAGEEAASFHLIEQHDLAPTGSAGTQPSRTRES